MKLILGIELGSTRIKSVLTSEKGEVLAQGSHEWENSLSNGLWTYPLEEVKRGLQSSYADLVKNFGKPIEKLDAMGISAMMHGYLALDDEWNLLTPFRTWRNTNTQVAADELTELFGFNIPLRWSAAHYYQSILDKEAHVDKVAHMTTLAGYVHYMLTGKDILGVGDASGMFPTAGCEYCPEYAEKFRQKTGRDIIKLLPEIMPAGQNAGTLTESGAAFLDPSGVLKSGALVCPPEGDAGTGMVATNSIAPGTANVSAGTSAFLMAVLERPLKKVYKEIDIVATPEGLPVAMVHVNNCTSEINAWASLFEELIVLSGGKIDRGALMEMLFKISEKAEGDAGGIAAYNYFSGEPIAGVDRGVPALFRKPECVLNLAGFMRSQIYSAVAALRLGTEILHGEGVKLEKVCGHGGFFKTEAVGQKAMASALGVPVTVMTNAGEGGAWGMALLAGYALKSGVSLSDYLNEIFVRSDSAVLKADEKEEKNFERFMAAYKRCLVAEKRATEVF